MVESKTESLNALDWLLIVVLLGSLSGFAWYWYQSSVSLESTQQQFTDKWHNVLVIDMGMDENEVSEAVILKGEDVIILVPLALGEDIIPNHPLDYVGINNLQELGMLGPVSANIFDPQDANFLRMRLLVYSNNGTQKALIPLYQAGIRSISFDREHLLLRAQLHNIDAEQVVGSVILSDGTERAIHLVPVHDAIFAGQATLGTD